jgi:hypothetical protein
MKHAKYILALVLLVYPVQALANEPLTCETAYQIPKPVANILSQKKGAAIEIREQDPTGYIWSIFINRLYLEGVFFQDGDGIAVCEISFAVEVDTDGALVFIWNPSEKEM